MIRYYLVFAFCNTIHKEAIETSPRILLTSDNQLTEHQKAYYRMTKHM